MCARSADGVPSWTAASVGDSGAACAASDGCALSAAQPATANGAPACSCCASSAPPSAPWQYAHASLQGDRASGALPKTHAGERRRAHRQLNAERLRGRVVAGAVGRLRGRAGGDTA